MQSDHVIAFRRKVEDLRAEVARIQMLNQRYWRDKVHDPFARTAHVQRLSRLQEIKQELPDGTWRYRVLHRFQGPPNDGKIPSSNMLLAMDASGNLYGTTNGGGRYLCMSGTCGVLFRLSRQPDGHWKETVLHHFKAGKGGYWPSSGVVIDSAGNLYGVTGAGGNPDCDCGAVYKLASNPDGTWTYTVLHRFKGYDGLIPNANLVMDDKGNMYGTTQYGGPYGGGVVFKITP